MDYLLLLAEQTEVDKWLEKNPAVLGGGALVLGLLLIAWGTYELMTGTARAKFGHKVTGTGAKVLALARIVGGAFFAIFGIFKMVAG